MCWPKLYVTSLGHPPPKKKNLRSCHTVKATVVKTITYKKRYEIGLPQITADEYIAFPPDPPIPQASLHASDGVAK